MGGLQRNETTIEFAGWGLQGSYNEPIRFDALISSPNIALLANIQLPDDFVPELDKIEAFYDQHLKDRVPITFSD